VSGDGTDRDRNADANESVGERTVIPERTALEGRVIEGRTSGPRSAGPLLIRWQEDGRVTEAQFETGITIGRDASCEVRVGDETVSRRHAELLPIDGRWHVRDLGSGNGTLLDDVRVTDAVVPRQATLQLGTTTRIALESPDAPAEASKRPLRSAISVENPTRPMRS